MVCPRASKSPMLHPPRRCLCVSLAQLTLASARLFSLFCPWEANWIRIDIILWQFSPYQFVLPTMMFFEDSELLSFVLSTVHQVDRLLIEILTYGWGRSEMLHWGIPEDPWRNVSETSSLECDLISSHVFQCYTCEHSWTANWSPNLMFDPHQLL